MRRHLTRHLNRRLNRPLTRRCSRRTVRRIGRGPRIHHLGRALTAFRRAVRLRVRLMQLAPEIFDEAVVRRRAVEHEARQLQMAQVEAALIKVYGPAAAAQPEKLHHPKHAARCRNGAETVQFSPRKTHKIETTLVEWELWMAAGRHEFDRHQHLSPHRRVSLGTLARLVDIATQLGCLATGMELKLGRAKKPNEEKLDFRTAHPKEALERIYGGGIDGFSTQLMGDRTG